jgi:hypothetical protein
MRSAAVTGVTCRRGSTGCFARGSQQGAQCRVKWRFGCGGAQPIFAGGVQQELPPDIITAKNL